MHRSIADCYAHRQSWKRRSPPTSKYSWEHYFWQKVHKSFQSQYVQHILYGDLPSFPRLSTPTGSLVGVDHVRGRINSGQTNHNRPQHLTSSHSQKRMRIKFRPRCNQLLKNKIVKEGPRWASPTILHQLPDFSLHECALQLDLAVTIIHAYPPWPPTPPRQLSEIPRL